MDIFSKWTVELNYDIRGGGVLLPTIDPVDPSVFYISDGTGTPYSAMRFRKMSVENGTEKANILTRDAVRCLYANEQWVFAVLNKRILKLNREDFHIEYTYRQSVPLYSDYINSDDSSHLLLMNGSAAYLHIYHLQTQKVRKKKISECCGITKATDGTFLIFDHDHIFLYELPTNTLKKVLDTEIYRCCERDTFRKIYLLCEDCVLPIGTEQKVSAYSSRILVYPPDMKIDPEEIVPGVQFRSFRVSANGELLYLYTNDRLWLYSVLEKRIVFEHNFQGQEILNVFENRNMVITHDAGWNDYHITGWAIC